MIAKALRGSNVNVLVSGCYIRNECYRGEVKDGDSAMRCNAVLQVFVILGKRNRFSLLCYTISGGKG